MASSSARPHVLAITKKKARVEAGPEQILNGYYSAKSARDSRKETPVWRSSAK